MVPAGSERPPDKFVPAHRPGNHLFPVLFLVEQRGGATRIIKQRIVSRSDDRYPEPQALDLVNNVQKKIQLIAILPGNTFPHVSRTEVISRKGHFFRDAQAVGRGGFHQSPIPVLAVI